MDNIIPVSTVQCSLAEYNALLKEIFQLKTELNELKQNYEEICKAKKVRIIEKYLDGSQHETLVNFEDIKKHVYKKYENEIYKKFENEISNYSKKLQEYKNAFNDVVSQYSQNQKKPRTLWQKIFNKRNDDTV